MFKKLLNREVAAYLVAGVLTTLVNIIVYHISCNILGIENLIANGIAWIVSVLFAFVVNDKYVFIQEKVTAKQEFIKIIKFFLARLFSFFIDEFGMLVLVNILLLNNMLSKVGMNVIVIILNYIFSKLFIFQVKKENDTSSRVTEWSSDGNREEV